MNGFVDIYTIIFLVLAVVIFFRLRSVLGRRTGSERPPFDPYSRREAPPTASGDEKVISLPPRRPTGAADAPGVIAPAAEAQIKTLAPEGSSLNEALRAIATADRNFDPDAFIGGAKGAYEMIVTAFAEGDRKALKQLLNREVYRRLRRRDRRARGPPGDDRVPLRRHRQGRDHRRVAEGRHGADHRPLPVEADFGHPRQGRHGRRRRSGPCRRRHRHLDLRARGQFARSELEAGRDRIGRVSARRPCGRRWARLRISTSNLLISTTYRAGPTDDHRRGPGRLPPRRLRCSAPIRRSRAPPASTRQPSPPRSPRAADGAGDDRRRGAGLLRGRIPAARSRAGRPAAASSPAITSRSSPVRGPRRRPLPTPLYAPAGRPRRDRSGPRRRRASSRAPASPGALPTASPPTRTAAAIEAGFLAGRGLELVYPRRSGRRLLHPHPGRGPHPARRRRRDADHLRGQERPSLYADRPGADRRRAPCRPAARPCRRSAAGSPTTRTRRGAVMAREPLLHLLPRGGGRRSGARPGRRRARCR